MEKVYYKIEENRLFNLLKAEAELEALESGGVDNWGWCGYAANDYINAYVEANPGILEPGETANCISFDDIAAYQLLDWERVTDNEETDFVGG